MEPPICGSDPTNIDELKPERLDAFEKTVQGCLVQDPGQHRFGRLDVDIDVGESLAGRWTDLTQHPDLILHLSHCASQSCPFK